eukprot:TRINITY_DN4752_c0_g1_i1.p1 TRINITY_DN4752_c0_g1~~TRINITY_DN4752_c0_g1_i1.p1  ORF type:complete len:486 (+),score=75.70 TRINITY_DN4752_c0_g1_i1:244-1701(+)
MMRMWRRLFGLSDNMITNIVKLEPDFFDSQKFEDFSKESYLDSFSEFSPQQIHLSLGRKHNSMCVTWVTTIEMEEPVCEFHCVSVHDEDVEKVVRTEHAEVRVIESGWEGFIYCVEMTDLEFSSKYEYRVGDLTNDIWSESYVYKVRPNGPFQMTAVTFADYDTVLDIVKEKTVIQRLAANLPEFDMVLEFGDVCYADGNPDTWDLFFNHVQPIAAVKPWMVAVGNHENEEVFGFEHYDKRFSMPGGNNFWYSFDYGYGHWIMVSTEHSLAPGSEQMEWLINDLSRANRARNMYPWIIITGHRALYGSNTRWFHKEKAQKLKKRLIPIIDKYDVDLAIFGHCHAYERTHPLKNGKIDPNGTIYLLAGVAGADLDKEWKIQPQWSAYRTAHHGYGLLHMKSDKKLRFCYTRERDGQSWDSFTIKKNRAGKKQIYYDYENRFLSNWYNIPEKPHKKAKSEQKLKDMGYDIPTEDSTQSDDLTESQDY